MKKPFSRSRLHSDQQNSGPKIAIQEPKAASQSSQKIRIFISALITYKEENNIYTLIQISFRTNKITH